MAFRRAVDNPDFVRFGPQVGAHLLKAGAVQKAGRGDEADNARLVALPAFLLGRVAVAEYLPGGPAPEVHVEVAEVLGVRSDVPFERRHPVT